MLSEGRLYLMLLSLLLKNFPRMLMARTRRALSDGVSMIVSTVSYKIELPTFLDDSVLVATYLYHKITKVSP